MSITAHTLAEGPGWRVTDVICSAGPQDRPFEERHDSVCIAAVTSGTFQYRSAKNSATLAPGALVLGNPNTCFECGHEHGVGDRCLAFNFTPERLESIVAAVPGARAEFSASSLPPLTTLLPLLANAEAARDEGDKLMLEEIAVRLAGAVATTLAQKKSALRSPSRADERRITMALRWIEREAEAALTLDDLAGGAAMSPFHFLRTFRHVAGMTPHQYILRTRLHRAAVLLRRSAAPVTEIAYAAGFNDLSTFNRRFRRLMGASPSAYRGQR